MLLFFVFFLGEVMKFPVSHIFKFQIGNGDGENEELSKSVKNHFKIFAF